MAERLVALLVLAASGAYLWAALSFPRGIPARPGPGFFPLAVGVFLCVVSAALVIAAFRRPLRAATPGAAAPAAGGRARVWTTAGGLVLFCALLPWLGYPLAAFGLVALLLRRLGGGGWTGVLALAVASTAASYYLFAVLLSVPLPRGDWLP